MMSCDLQNNYREIEYLNNNFNIFLIIYRYSVYNFIDSYQNCATIKVIYCDTIMLL